MYVFLNVNEGPRIHHDVKSANMMSALALSFVENYNPYPYPYPNPKPSSKNWIFNTFRVKLGEYH